MKRIISVILFVLMLANIFASCGSSVPRPKIESGEFNFSVTYELNGVQKTISGIYICEYDGASWALDGGYSRDWIGYIKDDKTDELIDIGTTADGEEITLDLGLNPYYFMDDFVEGVDEIATPNLVVTCYGEGISFESDADVIEEKYGAKIVAYEYDDPIENTFG